jgi:uracil-DNA glycosylase
VKVVIVGEDPYPNRADATGLAFSVNPGQKLPRALERVFDLLEADLKVKRPARGDLECWAKQGVLLLNRALTVPTRPDDHDPEWQRKRTKHRSFWSGFTERTIAHLSDRKDPSKSIAFLFWGTRAWHLAPHVRSPQHFVRLAGHPVPRRRGGNFANSQHFSQTKFFLEDAEVDPIQWDCVGDGDKTSSSSG